QAKITPFTVASRVAGLNDRRGEQGLVESVAVRVVIKVTLQGKLIDPARMIQAETTFRAVPGVIGVAVRGCPELVAGKCSCVQAEGGVIIDFSAMTRTHETVFKTAAADAEQCTLGIRGFFGNNIDYTV